MELNRLKQIIEAYGAEPDHWPEEERSAALALLYASQEAQELVEAEKNLDDLLGLYHVEAPSEELVETILKQATTENSAAAQVNTVLHNVTVAQEKPSFWNRLLSLFDGSDEFEFSLKAMAPSALVLVLCMFLGMAAGLYVPLGGSSTSFEDVTEQDIMALAFASVGPAPVASVPQGEE